MSAAVIGTRMNHVLRKYIEAGATSPQHAYAPQALGLRPEWNHRQALVLLRKQKSLVEAAPGAYYVDMARLRQVRKNQLWTFAAVMMVLMVPVVASFLL